MDAWSTVIGQRTMESINSMAREVCDNSPTLRDQFAMATLSGLQANSSPNIISFKPEELAAYCYKMADAMLKERKVK